MGALVVGARGVVYGSRRRLCRFGAARWRLKMTLRKAAVFGCVFSVVVFVVGGWGTLQRAYSADDASGGELSEVLKNYVAARWTRSAASIRETVTEEDREAITNQVDGLSSDDSPGWTVRTVRKSIKPQVDVEIQKTEESDETLEVTAKVTQPTVSPLRYRLRRELIKAGVEHGEARFQLMKAVQATTTDDQVEVNTTSETFTLRGEEGDWRVDADVERLEFESYFPTLDELQAWAEADDADLTSESSMRDRPLQGVVAGVDFKVVDGYVTTSDREGVEYVIHLYGSEIDSCDPPIGTNQVRFAIPESDADFELGGQRRVRARMDPAHGNQVGTILKTGRIIIDEFERGGEVVGRLAAGMEDDRMTDDFGYISGRFEVGVGPCL
jgi:hypothetical protein